MINLLKILIFSFVIVCLNSSPSYAQKGKDVGLEEYKEIIKDVDYSEKSWTLVPRDKSISTKKEKKEDEISTNSGGMIFQILGYIGIFGILALILIAIFKNIDSIKDTKLKQELDLDKIKEIEKVDFDVLFKNAMESKNYRVALRIKFLMIIQRLTTNGTLKWKPDKTNRTYVREISNLDTKNDFQKIVSIFERVWYGNLEINEDIFNVSIKHFDSFLNSLRK